MIINRIKFEQLWPAPWLSKNLARSMSVRSYFSCGHFEYPRRFSCLLFLFQNCDVIKKFIRILLFSSFFSFPHFRCGDEWQTVMLTRQMEEQLLQTKSTALFFSKTKSCTFDFFFEIASWNLVRVLEKS